MSVPPTFRQDGSDRFEPLTINISKIRVMLAERRVEAEAASLKVAALQKRLQKLASTGTAVPAAQVAENLNLVATFYRLEGRVTQLEELLRDFEMLAGNRDAGTARPPVDRNKTEFRL